MTASYKAGPAPKWTPTPRRPPSLLPAQSLRLTVAAGSPPQGLRDCAQGQLVAPLSWKVLPLQCICSIMGSFP